MNKLIIEFLIWCIDHGVYNRFVCWLANQATIRYTFVKILAGGNTKFPAQVLELAREKLDNARRLLWL
jgi:hypothetical protein